MEIKIEINKRDKKWLGTSYKFIDRAIEEAMPKIALFAEGKAKQDFTKSRGPKGGLHVRTGHLRRSITSKARDNTASIGSNVVYSAIHELGGTIPRGDSITTIPQRPYLEPAFTENEDKIEDILLKELVEEWERE